MNYCQTCRVHIRGKSERCVLCGNKLITPDAAEDQDEVFPVIPPRYESHLAIRIMVFISLATIVSSFSVRMIYPTSINWPIFVLFGLMSAWLSLIVIVRKGHSISKIIIWQVMIVTLLSVFWDWQTGWHGWSLDYLIPILYVASEAVMYVTAKIMKLSVRDYITYALLDGLFGVVPILFILFDWVEIPYPSIICVAVSIIFLLAIFIFQGENILKELNKRMHI
ncbi:MAG: hypothetical protein EOM54_12735 [Clostridia bacterium]|nr:hypothetical protein [Clostridia bacterium]